MSNLTLRKQVGKQADRQKKKCGKKYHGKYHSCQMNQLTLYAAALTQSVKRGICLYLEILYTFFKKTLLNLHNNLLRFLILFLAGNLFRSCLSTFYRLALFTDWLFLQIGSFCRICLYFEILNTFFSQGTSSNVINRQADIDFYGNENLLNNIMQDQKSFPAKQVSRISRQIQISLLKD